MPTRSLIWLPLLAGAGVLLLVVVIWYLLYQKEHAHLRELSAASASTTELLIQRDLRNRIFALQRLAARWEAAGGMSREVWETDVISLIAQQPGYQAIAWADALLQIRLVQPLMGNEGAKGMSLNITPERRAAVTAAVMTRQPAFTPPIDLIQGERGFVALVPIFDGEEFAGMMVGAFGIRLWLKAVLMPEGSANYDIRVLLDNDLVFGAADAVTAAGGRWMQRTAFSVYGLDFAVEVSPAGSYLPNPYSRLSTVVLLSGLIFSLLFGWAVRATLMARTQSQQLRIKDHQLSSLLGNLPGTVFRFKNEANLPAEFISEGCLALTGYTREQFEKQFISWRELVHPDDLKRLWNTTRRDLLQHGQFEQEYRIITRDGVVKWVWSRGQARTSPSGDISFEGLTTDITPRKAAIAGRQRAEKEARDFRDKLAQVDRRKLLGEMATAIAHQINQPLSAMSMYARSGIRLLERATPNEEKIRDILEKLIAQSHRAGAIVERMQIMSNEHETHFEEVDCNLLVEEISILAVTEAQLRGINIKIELAAESRMCNCDRIQIQQVILNLVKNAIEAMIGSQCANGNSIWLHLRCDEQELMISVIDSGTGVDADKANQMYLPFSSEKDSKVGLGLSICTSIVDAHGGRLGFYNNELGGATFYFALPFSQRAAMT